jgi:hypothetical protein
MSAYHTGDGSENSKWRFLPPDNSLGDFMLNSQLTSNHFAEFSGIETMGVVWTYYTRHG